MLTDGQQITLSHFCRKIIDDYCPKLFCRKYKTVLIVVKYSKNIVWCVLYCVEQGGQTLLLFYKSLINRLWSATLVKPKLWEMEGLFYAYHIQNKFPFPIADTRHICQVFSGTKNKIVNLIKFKAEKCV